MKKIVILGCENSHANTFLEFIKTDEKYQDVQVLGVYSDEIMAAQKLKETYGVPVMSAYNECVGKVDGVIVTARHGDNHYKYAKPYIASGVPMFIDKPITVSEADALALVKDCQASGVKLTGGSSCVHSPFVQTLKKECQEKVNGKTIGGYIRCPINLENEYGGFFFYSEHLVGIMSTIFGYYPNSVKAYQNGGNLTVVFRYENYDVTGFYTDLDFGCYYAMRVSEHAVNGASFPIDSKCFQAEFDEFYTLLCGGEQTTSYGDFVAPVFVLNAIKKSLDTQSEVQVNKYEI